MTRRIFLDSLPLLITVSLVLSCSSDDQPLPVNEGEVITTMTVTLLPQGGGGTPVILRTRDLDGGGPNPPVVTVTGDFKANSTYDGTIELLNETVSPPEDITEEIEAEGDEHQFFFQPGGGINLQSSYSDQDSEGDPLGLSFSLAAGDAGTGTLTVILRHLPDKNAAGVSDGDITNAGGNTDINQSFSVRVQ